MRIVNWMGILSLVLTIGCGSSNGPKGDSVQKPGSSASSVGEMYGEMANGGCNKSSAPFGGGTGKESDPYLICSASHLEAMTGSYSASYYLLTSDLDMTNEKHTCSGAITGVFDGGGHVIKNFNADMYMGQENGMLFCQLYTFDAVVAEIKNLKVENVNILSKSIYFTAGLVGTNYRGKITNVHVTGNITGVRYVGGLVAKNSGIIQDSSFSGNVSGSTIVGGMAGTGSEFSIRNCHVSGQVSGESSIGGIVGEADEKLSLTGNQVDAQVTGKQDFGLEIGKRKLP